MDHIGHIFLSYELRTCNRKYRAPLFSQFNFINSMPFTGLYSCIQARSAENPNFIISPPKAAAFIKFSFIFCVKLPLSSCLGKSWSQTAEHPKLLWKSTSTMFKEDHCIKMFGCSLLQKFHFSVKAYEYAAYRLCEEKCKFIVDN